MKVQWIREITANKWILQWTRNTNTLEQLHEWDTLRKGSRENEAISKTIGERTYINATPRAKYCKYLSSLSAIKSSSKRLRTIVPLAKMSLKNDEDFCKSFCKIVMQKLKKTQSLLSCRKKEDTGYDLKHWEFVSSLCLNEQSMRAYYRERMEKKPAKSYHSWRLTKSSVIWL